MGDVFYIVGIGLTVLALVLSFVGLRAERFPTSRLAFAGVIGFMAALVAATCAFAVVLAREEQKHRAEELAHAEEEAAAAAEEPSGGTEAEEPGPAAEPAGGEVEKEPPAAKPIEVTSPADGSLVFEPDTLEAAAGPVALDYTNPSEVPHNIAIEGGGETIAESATVTGGDSATAEAELEAGEYVFYCAIPGHRESGMEGDLRVD